MKLQSSVVRRVTPSQPTTPTTPGTPFGGSGHPLAGFTGGSGSASNTPVAATNTPVAARRDVPPSPGSEIRGSKTLHRLQNELSSRDREGKDRPSRLVLLHKVSMQNNSRRLKEQILMLLKPVGKCNFH